MLAEIFVTVIECYEQNSFAVMHVWKSWYQELDRIEHTALASGGEALQNLGIEELLRSSCIVKCL